MGVTEEAGKALGSVIDVMRQPSAGDAADERRALVFLGWYMSRIRLAPR